jgi:predicted metal-dependent hydrolase
MRPYRLVRSNRRSVAIHITAAAEVEVRAPFRTPLDEIDQFVADKLHWIDKHVADMEQRSLKKAAFTLDYGDYAMLVGKPYPITAKDGRRAGFDGNRFYLPTGLASADIKHALVQVYKSLAKQLFRAKVSQYAQQMEVSPTAVRVTSAKTRWGSCSTRDSVSFSWMLVMADEDVIDYVVVHELAHILQHNHSTGFWQAVQAVLPDFRSRRLQLKQLQKTLAIQDWES